MATDSSGAMQSLAGVGDDHRIALHSRQHAKEDDASLPVPGPVKTTESHMPK